MPWNIGWIDEDLHIYDSSISRPFSAADQDKYFNEWFDFVNRAPAPLFALFDTTKWDETGAKGLQDPRFRNMGRYRGKIRVIAMVSNRPVTRAVANLGAALLGYQDWFHFAASREEAIAFLRQYATKELGKEEAQAQPSKEPDKKAQAQLPEEPDKKAQAQLPEEPDKKEAQAQLPEEPDKKAQAQPPEESDKKEAQTRQGNNL